MGSSSSKKEAQPEAVLKRRLTLPTLAAADLVHKRQDVASLPCTSSAPVSPQENVTWTPSPPLRFACASISKRGYEPDNLAKENQDSLFVHERFLRDGQTLFGVFDGHGRCGAAVSAFVIERLPLLLQANQNELDQCPIKALRKAFHSVNSELYDSTIDINLSGTTACMGILRGRQLIVANVGDSRACLGRREGGKLVAIELSRDHKPDLPDERARIEATGGRVQAIKFDEDEETLGPSRVWLADRNLPGLAMSRSLGDAVAQAVGVSYEPETVVRMIDDNDCILLFATDGLWEFISSQEAIDLIATIENPAEACQKLVDTAVQRWLASEEVIDDITVVLAKFQHTSSI